MAWHTLAQWPCQFVNSFFPEGKIPENRVDFQSPLRGKFCAAHLAPEEIVQRPLGDIPQKKLLPNPCPSTRPRYVAVWLCSSATARGTGGTTALIVSTRSTHSSMVKGVVFSATARTRMAID